MSPPIALLGTLDTKSAEYRFLSGQIRAAGCTPVLVDTGVFGSGGLTPDVTAEEVAQAAGASLADLRAAEDRGAAVATMADGAAAVLSRMAREGRVTAALAMGGSGGTSIAAHAMQSLPVGFPKLILSTVASGDTRPYVGARDIAMMHSVVDIAGINRVSAPILANAAAAVAGMARAHAPELATHPLLGATMFGVTTRSVDAARQRLEAADYEVLVFHATGTGGDSMEALLSDGFLSGVLDVTTTELADELVGGVMAAGPQRLRTAGRLGIPQVVSVGALDMVNFGAADTVPAQFADRLLYRHNPNVTLMRTTPEECAELGRRLAERLNAATGPTALYLPLRGVSALSVADAPFHDPAADAALFAALRRDIDADRVELVAIDTDINDPDFAAAMTDRLIALTRETAP
ncbi:Tm-1-like ATP-binding domain-containing protein [Spiractinospora alimapuensis]|uniref:Tm-1-like ATP-binding domain-containing protein n=1 Tax=Spiractinospora alimapuensis TaxID=2820884 RepID=UPI001F3EE612|nr:Tm-1-like ATP-binding domain-containing protein [Spiractinospora alimapuensis]QVQ54533.1 Tm-1-like ATP-binding domain-containing protein [Spiractinospora alimapuensis]